MGLFDMKGGEGVSEGAFDVEMLRCRDIEMVSSTIRLRGERHGLGLEAD